MSPVRNANFARMLNELDDLGSCWLRAVREGRDTSLIEESRKMLIAQMSDQELEAAREYETQQLTQWGKYLKDLRETLAQMDAERARRTRKPTETPLWRTVARR